MAATATLCALYSCTRVLVHARLGCHSRPRNCVKVVKMKFNATVLPVFSPLLTCCDKCAFVLHATFCGRQNFHALITRSSSHKVIIIMSNVAGEILNTTTMSLCCHDRVAFSASALCPRNCNSLVVWNSWKMNSM